MQKVYADFKKEAVSNLKGVLLLVCGSFLGLTVEKSYSTFRIMKYSLTSENSLMCIFMKKRGEALTSSLQ